MVCKVTFVSNSAAIEIEVMLWLSCGCDNMLIKVACLSVSADGLFQKFDRLNTNKFRIQLKKADITFCN